jgi:hypothetical protein
VLILPLSIIRWIEFTPAYKGERAHVPSEATFIAISVYNFSGAVNVLLFFCTRQGLLLSNSKPPKDVLTPEDTVEFGSESDHGNSELHSVAEVG